MRLPPDAQCYGVLHGDALRDLPDDTPHGWVLPGVRAWWASLTAELLSGDYGGVRLIQDGRRGLLGWAAQQIDSATVESVLAAVALEADVSSSAGIFTLAWGVSGGGNPVECRGAAFSMADHLGLCPCAPPGALRRRRLWWAGQTPVNLRGMTPTVFLDMNETLLDLSALDGHFMAAFGDPGARKQWFGLMLQLALTHTVLGEYRDFSELGRAALEALGEARGQDVPDDLPDAVAAGMRSLPAHPDTREGLEILRAGGARLICLTNNPQAVLDAQLENAGFADLVDGAVSVDPGRMLKPGRAAYEYGLSRTGAHAHESWLLAAHGWDISGARSAGLHTAFVERPGQAQNPLMRADISGPLPGVARALIGRLGGQA